MAIFGLDVSS